MAREMMIQHHWSATGMCRQGKRSFAQAPKFRVEWNESPMVAGAGEGIRTLDPNLGKVVLYP
jgi:hypothetical protein